MSIETDIFPITSADPTFGTTLRRYLMQDASGGAVDDSVNAEPLDVVTGTPIYQQAGYGDAIKSDGSDDGIRFVNTEWITETNPNTTHTDTTAMTLEIIVKMELWNNGGTWRTFADVGSLTFASGGWVFFGSRSPQGQNWSIISGAGSLAANISQAGFDPTDGDWVYFCCVYDSGESGDDRVELYAGSLTTPAVNLTTKTSTVGSQNMTALSKAMQVGQGYNNALQAFADGTVSAMRIQDVAFSLATAEQRYDDIKAWAAAGGLFLPPNMDGGMQELRGGMNG